MQGGALWGDIGAGPAPIGGIDGAMDGAIVPGIGAAAAAPAPGQGAAGEARGASVGQGSVWAPAWHAGSIAAAKMRES
jgi:hypothetical protein